MRTQNLLFLLIIPIFVIGIYGCAVPKTGAVAEYKTEAQQTEIERETPEGIDKYEPNNSVDKAASIEFDSEIKGTIYPKGDEDFYKFTVDASMIKNISIEMTNPGGRIEPVMKIHDPDGKINRVTPAKRGADLTAETTAKSGDYLVEISDQKRGQSSKPYVLKISTEEKTKEERSSEGIQFDLE